MRRATISLVLLAAGAATSPAAGQDTRSAEVIDLNRRLLHRQIVERDAQLFQTVALDQFLVVAPGGVVENKEQAAAGVRNFDAVGISVTDERVEFEGNTAVLVGRLEIEGEMRPVGALPPMKFMSVFVDGPEGWRLLARALTPCFAMAIERGYC